MPSTEDKSSEQSNPPTIGGTSRIGGSTGRVFVQGSAGNIIAGTIGGGTIGGNTGDVRLGIPNGYINTGTVGGGFIGGSTGDVHLGWNQVPSENPNSSRRSAHGAGEGTSTSEGTGRKSLRVMNHGQDEKPSTSGSTDGASLIAAQDGDGITASTKGGSDGVVIDRHTGRHAQDIKTGLYLRGSGISSTLTGGTASVYVKSAGNVITGTKHLKSNPKPQGTTLPLRCQASEVSTATSSQKKKEEGDGHEGDKDSKGKQPSDEELVDGDGEDNDGDSDWTKL